MRHLIFKAAIGVTLAVLAFQLFLIMLCVTGQDELIAKISHFLIY